MTHVVLLSVPVSDQDRSTGFSVHTLGFELVTDTATAPGTLKGTAQR